MGRTIELSCEAVKVGDTEPLAVLATDDDGTPKDPNPATTKAVALDPDVTDAYTGTADADGTAEAFVSSALANIKDPDGSTVSDNYLNGMPCTVERPSTGKTWRARVTDYDVATGTVTLGGLPVLVAKGDVLTILGQVLIPQTVPTVTTNKISVARAAANTVSRRVQVIIDADFGTAVDVLWCDYQVN